MSDLLTDLDLKTERATEPPKRWRLKYEFPRHALIRCLTCKRQELKPKGIVWSCATFPSRDVALSMAADHNQYGLSSCVLLGAFPDGEAP